MVDRDSKKETTKLVSKHEGDDGDGIEIAEHEAGLPR